MYDTLWCLYTKWLEFYCSAVLCMYSMPSTWAHCDNNFISYSFLIHTLWLVSVLLRIFTMIYAQDVEEEKDAAEDASLKCVKYTRSPIMSTYLLAFVVGEFDFVEGKDSDGVVIRVYTPKGKTVQGKFALEVSAVYFSSSMNNSMKIKTWVSE